MVKLDLKIPKSISTPIFKQNLQMILINYVQINI